MYHICSHCLYEGNNALGRRNVHVDRCRKLYKTLSLCGVVERGTDVVINLCLFDPEIDCETCQLILLTKECE